jgi:hypothetical protein
MATAASAFQAGTNKDQLLTAQDVRRYQRIFEAQAVRSYLYLSLGIGLIAIALPVLLVIAGSDRPHDSISSFYHDPTGSARDVLVGSLCAVGVFLFLFHGLSKLENWLLNVAGVAIIAVALIPSPGTGSGSPWPHRGAAILFFVLIGIVAIFLSKGRIKNIRSERKKRWFTAAYNSAGAAMIVLPVFVAALQGTNWVFLTEWAAIWTFSAYWLLKTFEYSLLLRIRWMG